jgi:outer membrane lipoprotein SlyB
MKRANQTQGPADRTVAAAAAAMILCCAVGPAALGAAAGDVIGGWLGIACAVVLAAVAGVLFHRRRRGSC